MAYYMMAMRIIRITMDIPRTIVCLGDSITNNQDDPSYVNYWQELCDQTWGPKTVKIIATGVNGETAYDAIQRLEMDVFVHHPDLVTILYGHNELSQSISPKVYMYHLEQIIRACRKHGIPVIWLLTPNQIAHPLIASSYQLYRKALEYLAISSKTKLVDLWKIFDGLNLDQIYTYTYNNQESMERDYLHPNENGHRLMAQKLFETLQKMVK